MKFCGIDLHSNNSVVVVTDETDRVLVSRRCPNELTPIIALLDPHRDELAGVVVESTYNWYWLVDGLMAAGLNVKLANPVAMKRYDGLKHSDDKDDAVFLAHLLRLGILPTAIFILRTNERYEIWRVNEFNWFAQEPSTSWPSKISLHVNLGIVLAVMKSKAFQPHLLTGWACQ
ncbi:IS110 family transposase [Pseudomonas viciae]|uniref:IS110 family transposase n=1 Tax=Pseudomonas viciae TaxID=2505979 RepID=UPI001EE2D611|nr:IS110 family transposase [Pseudomonas viciae]